jgi:hypothetical protein
MINSDDLGGFLDIAIAGAIKHHIRGKKPALVSLLVDKWNHVSLLHMHMRDT